MVAIELNDSTSEILTTLTKLHFLYGQLPDQEPSTLIRFLILKDCQEAVKKIESRRSATNGGK
jgi:hypothetical protein